MRPSFGMCMSPIVSRTNGRRVAIRPHARLLPTTRLRGGDGAPRQFQCQRRPAKRHDARASSKRRAAAGQRRPSQMHATLPSGEANGAFAVEWHRHHAQRAHAHRASSTLWLADELAGCAGQVRWHWHMRRMAVSVTAGLQGIVSSSKGAAQPVTAAPLAGCTWNKKANKDPDWSDAARNSRVMSPTHQLNHHRVRKCGAPDGLGANSVDGSNAPGRSVGVARLVLVVGEGGWRVCASSGIRGGGRAPRRNSLRATPRRKATPSSGRAVGSDAADDLRPLRLQLGRVSFVRLLLALGTSAWVPGRRGGGRVTCVLETAAPVVLQQAVIAAVLTLAKAAIADDALGRLLAVLGVAANLLWGHDGGRRMEDGEWWW
ncbi:hypothetical protein DCS_01466 [Drechmeria coniospora]|uniref:Uncharacterized protein n=1 Tax=Drechmeria coniospora TaxID=98403 RepID=A0A151GT85_DRECN|nr:hypothetical protein DCS_01466 [Drechmeria coniospora]KYK60329.1 hypothetical protein DCS_01466 [Drechmeria coniospora]